jgi:V-type H+-transporting ATPase subunit a
MATQQDTLFRSASMSLTQLYISNEIGREVCAALGELGVLQFRDLNGETSAFQRTFTKEIRRLDNVERQLRYFKAQMEKAGIVMRSHWDFDEDMLAAPQASEIDELAERAESLEQRVSSLNDSYQTLKKRETELTEWRWVLKEAGGFFDRAHGQTEDIRQSLDDDDAPLLRNVEAEEGRANGDVGQQQQQSFAVMNIGFVSGVIPRERLAAFERILWRTLRGNLYMNQSEIPEAIINPENNEEIRKNVFVIFAHGKEIISKIRKISESLGADLYNVDENSDLRRDQIHEVNTRLSDLASVLRNTKNTLDAELNAIARSLAAWLIVIKKEKAIFDALNRFSYDQARKTLIAEAWIPTNALPQIRATLQDVNDRAGLSVPTIVNQIKTNKTPPTYSKTNKFTEGFQTIINAYGTAKYQEVNPGIYTIVTFPFLFAVMFGDFGHGCLMMLAASAMIYWEKPLSRSKQDELFAMAFYGRYIMMMMGVYSMFTGLVYNDVFSKGFSPFASAWEYPEDGRPEVSAHLKGSYRYPFGMDWAWHGSENDLLFSNSFKMKLSILMGWCHMTFALCFSAVNSRHFKTPIDFWGNFLPGMIFFQSIFGYLAFCIVYKWSIDWYAVGRSPPSLLNMLIQMFLSPGTVEEGEQLYAGQAGLQVALVLVAVINVPILLLLKPFYLRWQHKRTTAQGYRGIGDTRRVTHALDDNDDEHNDDRQMNGRPSEEEDEGAMITENIGDEEQEEFEFSEIMIHQTIRKLHIFRLCTDHC